MIQILKSSFALIALMVSTSIHAEWAVKNVNVVATERLVVNLGGLPSGFGSTAYDTVRIIYITNEHSQLPAFPCSPNTNPIGSQNNIYQASHWAPINSLGIGQSHAMHQEITALAQSAQAQGLPIDILFDSSGCDQSSAAGYGGFGRRVQGMRVRTD